MDAQAIDHELMYPSDDQAHNNIRSMRKNNWLSLEFFFIGESVFDLEANSISDDSENLVEMVVPTLETLRINSKS